MRDRSTTGKSPFPQPTLRMRTTTISCVGAVTKEPKNLAISFQDTGSAACVKLTYQDALYGTQRDKEGKISTTSAPPSPPTRSL